MHTYPTPNHILPSISLCVLDVYPSGINIPKHFAKVVYFKVKKLRVVGQLEE